LPLVIRPLLETTASAPAGDDDSAALDAGPRDDALAGMLQTGLGGFWRSLQQHL
jgi:hypothetical protein